MIPGTTVEATEVDIVFGKDGRGKLLDREEVLELVNETGPGDIDTL